MKIFISWSGAMSHRLALIMKEWLPYIVQEIDAFVSSEDIEKGAQWSGELIKELEASKFGIICVTPANVGAPWMNFEAGALSTRFTEARVVPYLFAVDRSQVAKSPLGQFQSSVADEGDTFRLVKSINGQAGNRQPEDQLKRTFDKWWPDLRRHLENLQNEFADTPELSAVPRLISPQPISDSSSRIVRQYADLDVGSLLKDAKRRADCFVVSGRHMFNSPQISTIILEKIADPLNSCRIRILAMDSIGDDTFVECRNTMMDMGGFVHGYDHDLALARETARQLSQADPEHKIFDMRFYTLMPTTFFFLCDDVLYQTHLLCKPVAMCPVTVVDLARHPTVAWAFETHFEHYWKSSRYYVTMIGWDAERKQFLMVHNRKRTGWEWPSGYIEPAENPLDSARREFAEETGYNIDDVIEVERTPFGIYYTGNVTGQISAASAREVDSVRWFSQLPPVRELSFQDEHLLFKQILGGARRALGTAT
jgi:8-oxo-dGTP pyrophosphatase MutT (NUDIX family)